MDEPPTFLGTHSNYVFDRHAGERDRLRYQYELLREDFNLWFDDALRLAGLPADPDAATWSVLDIGCGEGHYAREIARRYPYARVVGVDSDASAIEVAAQAGPGVEFLIHDAKQPLPGGDFDIAVMWMVLLYLPDRRSALTHLADVLRPGGVALLGNVPDEPVRLAHPAAERILSAGRPLLERLGMVGLEGDLEPLLRAAGFDDVTSAVLSYPAGGPTSYGQRWYRHARWSMQAGRAACVQITGLMDEAEYDRCLAKLDATPVRQLSGEVRFLATLAKSS